MRRDVAARLADALESDRYSGHQCTTVLSVGEGDARKWDVYGVLCDLSVEEGIIGPPLMDGTSKRWEYDGRFYDLPIAVAAWAELTTADRFIVVRISAEPRGLVGLNDSGATPPELAAALRASVA